MSRRASELLRSPRDAWLVLRMLAWAAVLPPLKFALPLPRLVRLLSSKRDVVRRPQREARTSELASLLYRSSRADLGDNCLERSLVTYRYLGRLGAEPSLVVAVATAQRDVIGHVWVSVDGRPVHDAPEFVARFVPILLFDPNGRVSEALSEPHDVHADAR
jgi:hypothetical protein